MPQAGDSRAANNGTAPVALCLTSLEQLCLHVCWHCAQGSQKWAPLLGTLPAAVESPVLWPEQQRSQLLRGSPVS